jgi:UDP-3-O-acyl-N-acetylglucosamine deacetylase
MLSGYRIFGRVKTSQGGHALTNKLLIKFFSDKSNWSLENGNIVEKNNQAQESFKKTLSASI